MIYDLVPLSKFMIVLKSLGDFGILNSVILIFYEIFEMTDKVVEISLDTYGLYETMTLRAQYTLMQVAIHVS